MIDVIVVAIIVVLVGSALAYIIKAKKNGIKCIGCPDAKSCSSGSHAGQTVSGCGGGSCANCNFDCHANEK